jgi:hypothetical protein
VIDITTFLLTLALAVFADAVEVFTLGTLGWFISILIDIKIANEIRKSKLFTTAEKWKFIFVGLVGERVPGLNILPMRSVAVIWMYIASRSKVAADFHAFAFEHRDIIYKMCKAKSS